MLSNGDGELSGISILSIPASMSTSAIAGASLVVIPRKIAIISRCINGSLYLLIGFGEARKRHVNRVMALRLYTLADQTIHIGYR